ncbi:Ubiquitin-conjugating enzyme E2 6 [Vanrija albida]|uniref:Ubiquitin-conjugating enzyme E2 6 n=1 Tax=Vanrija albida TaxID=181172 RepID=A0ABR3Q8X7_9TREE
MASKVAQKRLQKEYLAMQKSPPPFIWAVPEEKNILDWHFIIRGPPDTPYAGGEYHGLIWFPSDYPFKPPDVKMFTPSGRFEPGVKICMSMTSYHPSTWNAAWSVATILTGLLSFMLSDEITAGAVKTTDEQKRQLATQSHGFNLKSKKFKDIFPTYATPAMTDLPDMGQQKGSTAAGLKRAAASDVDTPVSSVRSTPLSTAAPTRNQSPAVQPPIPTPANTEPAQQQAAQQALHVREQHGRPWMPSWRWLVAIVLLAVLGRLSTGQQ